MSRLPSRHENDVASLHVSSDDGRLHLAELGKLLALALRDAVVDEDEKRVLPATSCPRRTRWRRPGRPGPH